MIKARQCLPILAAFIRNVYNPRTFWCQLNIGPEYLFVCSTYFLTWLFLLLLEYLFVWGFIYFFWRRTVLLGESGEEEESLRGSRASYKRGRKDIGNIILSIFECVILISSVAQVLRLRGLARKFIFSEKQSNSMFVGTQWGFKIWGWKARCYSIQSPDEDGGWQWVPSFNVSESCGNQRRLQIPLISSDIKINSNSYCISKPHPI